ncbi:hypothetical protein LshimejAT787_1802320 [Lyophyllum shimeji]|uniref:Uncharacterized protein n=1 Tax=Lyophyllum shimeji TaxID=47721 RepID=A0A9P3PXL5_LYOSH|nr:hypothetical protein LshimejAT787_1802320 [Lyophyllum shimeji]
MTNTCDVLSRHSDAYDWQALASLTRPFLSDDACGTRLLWVGAKDKWSSRVSACGRDSQRRCGQQLVDATHDCFEAPGLGPPVSGLGQNTSEIRTLSSPLADHSVMFALTD